MGLLDRILGRQPKPPLRTSDYFTTFTSYSPAFSSFSGGIYEQQLTRAVVERFATACSKLKPEVSGSAKPRIRRAIETSPNDYMTWPQLIARVATILEVDTTAYVVPAFDRDGRMTGVWPLRADLAELVEWQGQPWVRFTFRATDPISQTGNVAAIELENVCILTRFQYDDDFFGSGNRVLEQTMRVADLQTQAQEEAMRTAPALRFIGKLGSAVRPEDMEKKRELFVDRNLSASNSSGILVYDQTWESIQQLSAQSYTIPTEEMERIDENVYSYFGINKSILQNDYSEEQWGAYYEGRVEPFAVQLSEGLTRMLYTENERARGNRIMFSSNRLEYATNASKRNMIRDMTDRQIMTINEAREVLQLPPVPGGDVFIERGEYMTIGLDGTVLYTSGGHLGNEPQSSYKQEDRDIGGDEDEYNAVDSLGQLEEDSEKHS